MGRVSAKEARGFGVPERARRTLLRVFYVPVWVLVAVLTVSFAAGLRVPEWVQYAPFALSLLLFGIPHGAQDHLVPGRLSGRGAGVRSVLGVALLYAVLSSLYLALWFVSPAAAFVLFILLTWFHWGQGDLYSVSALVPGRQPPSPAGRALTALVRGGLPMLVPLVAFPEVYAEVARSAAASLDPARDQAFLWVTDPVFGTVVGAALAAAVALDLLRAVLSGAGRGFAEGAAVEVWEVLLLAAYFFFVPPVLAVGLYFCLWHAPRHVARLMLLDGRATGALRRGRPLGAFGRFFRDAAPLTLAALGLLVGLYFALPGGGTDLPALLALYLVLISLLTLPHVVVVAWMDRAQGLWRSPGVREAAGLTGDGGCGAGTRPGPPRR